MPQTVSKRQEIRKALQSTLENSIRAGVPVFSAAICFTHEILLQYSTSLADKDAQKPIENAHLFGIGSITKVFVSVVILQLVDENLLKLSDTVGDHLATDAFQGIENAEMVTMEGLLSHTAGVESWEDGPIWIVEGRGKALDPRKLWGKTETLDYIRRPNPSGPKPGEWSYSNTNFTLLGLVIEKSRITQQKGNSVGESSSR
jgi:D-alanyl-D-alanine carboxypeptidase